MTDTVTTTTTTTTKEEVEEGVEEGVIVEREDIHDRLPRLWRNELRLVRLANGLRVVLSSNPDADTCACTMVVRCGSFMDPPELPGLAHFCEHMLFLGTRKYPAEGDFEAFLRTHRGTHNASTGAEHTTYYFSVLPAGFAGALDRFAQFFVAPLFTEGATERELSAITSEHEKNVPDEARRMHAVLQTACVPGHPLAKFGTGTRATLTARGLGDLRAALLRLFDARYTPRNMVLALEGPLSLAALERHAAACFAAVPVRAGADGHGTPPPLPAGDPVAPYPADAAGHTRLLLRYVPLTPQRAVHVTWPVAGDLDAGRGGDAMDYIANLLGHEADGSVLALLKARGWATALVAGLGYQYSSFFAADCTVELTPAGFAHWEDVVATVYAYIGMLRAQPPSRAHFDEASAIEEISYTFAARKDPLATTRALATAAADGVPTQELVSHTSLLLTFDPDRIGDILAHMSPDNAVTLLTAPELAPACPDTERWYGARYSRAEPVPDALHARWCAAYRAGDPSGALHMPAMNPFAPSLAGCAVLGPLDRDVDDTVPARVYEDAQCTCFWKQDRTFGEPRLHVRVLLANRHTRSTLKECCCTALFEDVFRHALNRFAYMAELAGINGGFATNPRGLVLAFDGLCEKLDTYAEHALRELRAFEPDEHLFGMVKTRAVETVERWRNRNAYAQAYALLGFCMRDASLIPRIGFEDVLPTITLQDLRDWRRTFFETGVRIVTFFEGNITEARAVELTKRAQRTLALPVAPQAELLTSSPCEVARGRTTLDLPRFGDDTNSAVVMWRGNGVRPRAEPDIESVYTMLAANLVRAPFFDTLRTKQQLGYVVMSTFSDETFSEGVGFVVQSSGHAPDDICRRIGDFLAETPRLAEALTDEAFGAAVRTLVESLSIKPKKLAEDAERNWPPISQGYLEFESWRTAIELARQCTKEGLVAYMRSHLVPGGADEREFTVRLWGQYKSQAEFDAAHEHDEAPNVHFTSAKDIFAHNVFKAKPIYHKVLRI